MSVDTWTGATLTGRLGHPQTIAAAAECSRLPVRFARRHPLVTYLIVPVPLLLAFWVAYAAGLIGLANLFDGFRDAPWAVRLAEVLVHGIAYIPTLLLTFGIAWLAMRSQARFGWWCAATVLVALVSGMLMVTLTMPKTPGTGSLQLGLGVPLALAQWPQALLPLGVTAVFMLRAKLGRRDQTALQS